MYLEVTHLSYIPKPEIVTSISPMIRSISNLLSSDTDFKTTNTLSTRNCIGYDFVFVYSILRAKYTFYYKHLYK